MSAQLSQSLKAAIAELDWLPTSDATQAIWERQQKTLGELRKELAAFEAAPQQEPVGRVRFDSGEVHFHPFQRDAEASPLSDGAQLYAAPQQAQAPIDPDGEQSRAGFRAFDEAQMAQWATPWQVWREAVKWAAQQAQAPGWQPIETAPKGEEVILFAGDISIDDWGRYCRHNHPKFTHWMPLPAAPQQGSKS